MLCGQKGRWSGGIAASEPPMLLDDYTAMISLTNAATCSRRSVGAERVNGRRECGGRERGSGEGMGALGWSAQSLQLAALPTWQTW